MKVPQRVHLIGIGGTGMSSIAKVLLEQGKVVSGSDVAESDMVLQLRELGAQIYVGHSADNINGAELVVTSTAIAETNPELQAARERGIPIVHRSQLWAQFLSTGRSITVAGAHGKTTISAMIAWVLYQAGLDPTFLIGGAISELGGGRRGSSDLAVAEADESDGSFLRYRPWCTVLTSVEPDHLEHYEGDFARLVAAYGDFLANVRPEGLAVLCRDDETVMSLVPRLKARHVTYGLSADAEYSATNIRHDGFATTAEVTRQGRAIGTLELVIPGTHNVQNALAVVAVCREVGLDWNEIARHLASFRGAGRRFEVVARHAGVLVIDDYAHHPTEIRATLAAARKGWPDRRIIAVFQPHRLARTRFLFDEFAAAFADADHVIVTNVYEPSGARGNFEVSAEALAREISVRSGKGDRVRFIADLDTIPGYLAGMVQAGDMVLTLGAGDITAAARKFARTLGNST